MDFDQIFNLCESLLWFGVAFILWPLSNKVPQHRRILQIAAISFFFFGISDLIEIKTRAWYSPIWLLLLKALCIVTMLLSFLAYRRAVKSAHKDDKSNESSR